MFEDLEEPPEGVDEGLAARQNGAQVRLPYSTNVMNLYPGDHCLLLRSEREERAVKEHGTERKEMFTQHCILVGSMIQQGLGHPAERLIWVDLEQPGDGRATVRYVGGSNVTDLPT